MLHCTRYKHAIFTTQQLCVPIPGRDQQQARKAVPSHDTMRQLINSLMFLRSCARQQQQVAGAAALAASALAAANVPAAVHHSAHPGLQAACSCSTPSATQLTALFATARRYSTTTAPCKSAHGSDVPEQGGSYYWVPPDQGQTFTPDRRSIHERRATGRLELALESVLLADGYLREHLISRHGFSIHRVRYAKDRRTVHILWDAAPGQAEACQRALDKNAFRLRRDLAKVMASKYTPYLEFIHDHLPPLQAAAAEALEAAEQELAAATAAASRRAHMQAAAAAAAADAKCANGAEESNMQLAAAGAGASHTNFTTTTTSGSSGSSPSQKSSPVHADAAAAAGGQTQPPAAGTDMFAQDNIDAAIARLQAGIRPKLRRPGRD